MRLETLALAALMVVLLGALAIQQSCNESRMEDLTDRLSGQVIGMQRDIIRNLDSTIASRKDSVINNTKIINHYEANRAAALAEVRNTHNVDSLISLYYRIRANYSPD